MTGYQDRLRSAPLIGCLKCRTVGYVSHPHWPCLQCSKKEIYAGGIVRDAARRADVPQVSRDQPGRSPHDLRPPDAA